MPRTKTTIILNKKPKTKGRNKKPKNVSIINRSKPRPSPVIPYVGSGDARRLLKRPENMAQFLKNEERNPHVRLSECAAKYATAIANPWSPEATLACVPYGESRMSQKTSNFLRFDATVGTAGIGFVMITPTIANDLAYAWYTQGAFTGSTAAITSTGTAACSTIGVTAAVMSNLPYTNLTLNPGATTGANVNLLANRGRIVSVGVSASYTGTELNMGGLMYCYTDPQHGNQQGSTPGVIGQRGEADVSNVSRDKCWLMCSAVDTDELDFPEISTTPSSHINAFYPFSKSSFLDAAAASGPIYNGAAPMIIMFTGTPLNTVHIEIVQHTEYIGPITEAKTSPSIMDSVGTMTVLSAANAVPRMKQAHPSKKYGDLFYDALKHTGKELLPVAITALKAMLI